MTVVYRMKLHEVDDRELFNTPTRVLTERYGVTKQAVFSLRRSRSGVPKKKRTRVLCDVPDDVLNQPIQIVMAMYGVRGSTVARERKIRNPRPRGRQPSPVQTVPDDILFGTDVYVLAESIGVSPGTVSNERRRRKMMAQESP